MLVTGLDHAKVVLTSVADFDFPADVSRERVRRPADAASDRSSGPPTVHEPFAPLTTDAVDVGARVLRAELDVTGARLGGRVDAMHVLRDPVARSTTAAVLPDLDVPARSRVAEAVLAWIDALGPVIARTRPPGKWSRARRREVASREQLHSLLAGLGVARPAAVATLLAAGIQVPIAAGAWLLVELGAQPDLHARLRSDPSAATRLVWEVLRLRPPTWVTARMAVRDTRLGAVDIPAGTAVLVSPLLLGRLGALVPHERAPLESFNPDRWEAPAPRPGAWLPFGAGPHACPGRNLGFRQLVEVAQWARGFELGLDSAVGVNQSRGIFPDPAVLRLRRPSSRPDG